MKIMFLDLDSVVIISSFMDEEPRDPFGWEPMCQKCVAVLNEILDAEPELQIIVTSDRRRRNSLERMNEIFLHHGVKRAPVGVTGFIPTRFYPQGDALAFTRAEEIAAWLKVNNFSGPWVAVDDLNMTPWLENAVDLSLPVTTGLAHPGVKEQILKILKN